jgi:hypothetical protein
MLNCHNVTYLNFIRNATFLLLYLLHYLCIHSLEYVQYQISLYWHLSGCSWHTFIFAFGTNSCYYKYVYLPPSSRVYVLSFGSSSEENFFFLTRVLTSPTTAHASQEIKKWLQLADWLACDRNNWVQRVKQFPLHFLYVQFISQNNQYLRLYTVK